MGASSSSISSVSRRRSRRWWSISRLRAIVSSQVRSDARRGSNWLQARKRAFERRLSQILGERDGLRRGRRETRIWATRARCTRARNPIERGSYRRRPGTRHPGEPGRLPTRQGASRLRLDRGRRPYDDDHSDHRPGAPPRALRGVSCGLPSTACWAPTPSFSAPRSSASSRRSPSYCGIRHCVGVGSGTAALSIMMQAAGIEPGDEVIVPAHTFVASALADHARRRAAGLRRGRSRDTGLIDPEAVQDAVSPRTTAILAVHLYGQACAMGALREIAQSNGLVLLEDAAQAHGAMYLDERVGQPRHRGRVQLLPEQEPRRARRRRGDLHRRRPACRRRPQAA